jgi:hypothetical protein
MDYNPLRIEIQNYANRTDDFFIAQIPGFINKAMNRIYSEAESIGFEIVIRGNLIINDKTLPKADNWKQTISFNIIDDRLNPTLISLVEPRSFEFCQVYWPQPTTTAKPIFFADILAYNSFYFAPTPDYAYPFQLIYRGLPLFNEANSTNFLTLRYESLLLYACLFETLLWLKNDERIAAVEASFNRALQDVNKDRKGQITDRTSQRGKS